MHILILLVVLAGISVPLLIAKRKKARRRLYESMTPEEREYRQAKAEYESAVTLAEKNLKAARKSRDKQLKSLRAKLDAASRVGRSKVGSYTGRDGTVTLFEHQISVPAGTFALEPTMRARVETAGSLTVRSSGSRGVRSRTGRRISSSSSTKFQQFDTRELYLLVEGVEFSARITCRPGDGSSVRQLATQIDHAVKSVKRSDQAHAMAVQKASADLRQEEANLEPIESCEKALAAAKEDTVVMQKAKESLDGLTVGPETDDDRS